VKNAPDTKRFPAKGSWIKGSCKKVPTKNIPGSIKLLWKKGSWIKKVPVEKRFLMKKCSWIKKVPVKKRFLMKKGSWWIKGSWRKKVPDEKKFPPKRFPPNGAKLSLDYITRL
jgi:hypothetical protein